MRGAVRISRAPRVGWAGIWRVAVCAAGLVVAGGCRTVPFVQHSLIVRVGRPFVIAKSDHAMGWGYYSHPIMWGLPDGRLVVLYKMKGDLPAYGGQVVSSDGGRSWRSFESGIVTTDDLYGCVSLPDGGCMLYSEHMRTTGDGRTLMARRVVAADGSIGPPEWVEVDLGKAFETGTFMPHGVCDSDGVIYLPYYGTCEKRHKYTAVLMYSDDGGRHFRQRGVIASYKETPWGTHGPAEPTLMLLPDGTMLCLMRTGTHTSYSEKGGSTPMLLAHSRDGGRTWKKRFFPRPGVMPQLLRMTNGVLVCAFGRPGNNLMFSLDDGQHWRRETRLTRADARSSGYMGIAEVAPGRLLVVYDLYNTSPRKFWLWEPPEEINVVMGVYVDVLPAASSGPGAGGMAAAAVRQHSNIERSER